MDKNKNRTKILMVEDEPAFLRMMKKRLEYEGYRVVTAQNGLDGLSTARTENPSLIILDIMLPGMDGLKVCRMLKSDNNLRNIPVAMLTSRDMEEDAETAKRCGANAFIVKTTRTEVVIDIIKKLLD
jgi:two-component system alkaline phosphatase synthesis response regulator PhoP